MRTRFIASRDGRQLRTACWNFSPAGPRRGTCVIFDGQTEFIEKYGEVAGELAARGFSGAVLDWRGQGGSERALADPLKAHVGDFSEYDDDLSTFMDAVVGPLAGEPPLALAHSMGGHILLRALHARPHAFSAAVLTAPLLRPDTRGFPGWLVRAVCGAHVRAGLGDRFVWGMDGRDPLDIRFADNRVTSDRARFSRNQTLLKDAPALCLAGPTWGWLEAGYRSMARMSAPGFAEAVTTPCLVLGAGRDRVVSTEAIRRFAHRLPRGTYLELPEAEHEILMENDAIRAQFWSAFDTFVGLGLETNKVS
jgi:lysophospholipase